MHVHSKVYFRVYVCVRARVCVCVCAHAFVHVCVFTCVSISIPEKLQKQRTFYLRVKITFVYCQSHLFAALKTPMCTVLTELLYLLFYCYLRPHVHITVLQDSVVSANSSTTLVITVSWRAYCIYIYIRT